MRAAFKLFAPVFASRAAFLIMLGGLAGCSSEANRIQMPWNVPMASSGQSSQDITGSIGHSSVSSQALPPVASAAPQNSGVIVNRGDTIYVLAHRYHVSAASLMAANHIQNANAIKVGQRLVIPGMSGPAPAVPQTKIASIAKSVQVANDGTYTVNSGDTLSSVARRYNIAPGDLAKANHFQAQDRLYAGRKLIIPNGAALAAAKTADPITTGTIKPATPAAPQPAVHKQAEAASSATPESSGKGAKMEVAALPVPAPRDSTEFRWPVRGRVVVNYGPQQGGGRSDGIDIAVPAGTPIKAAENGVVAYAGNELKGYGNLVLIRHDGDFVTAYAHNSEILVKRGDKVTRGQVIGKAGQSGGVSQPQLHFEIRKGSTPIDPMQHLTGG